MGVDPGQQRSRPDGGWQPHRGRGAALLLPLSNLFSWTASGGVSDHLPGTWSMFVTVRQEREANCSYSSTFVTLMAGPLVPELGGARRNSQELWIAGPA